MNLKKTKTQPIKITRIATPIGNDKQKEDENYKDSIKKQIKFCKENGLEHIFINLESNKTGAECAIAKDIKAIEACCTEEYKSTIICDADAYFIKLFEITESNKPYLAVYEDGEPDLSIVYPNGNTKFFEKLKDRIDGRPLVYPFGKKLMRKRYNNYINIIHKSCYNHNFVTLKRKYDR